MAVGLRASSNALRQLTMRRRRFFNHHAFQSWTVLICADENHPECPDQVEVLSPTLSNKLYSSVAFKHLDCNSLVVVKWSPNWRDR